MPVKAPRIERYSKEEWLELEKQSGLQYEFLDGYVYAMAGESDSHNDIVGNIVEALRARTRAKGCRFRQLSYRVRIEDYNRYYYPDIAISCSDEPDPYEFHSPCFVLEVLSPSTADKDRREKREGYMKIPSLKTYVIVSQAEKRLEVYERQKASWTLTEIINDGEFEVACIGEKLSLDQIYVGLDIPDAVG
jgi:Uma2 family endonuclease